MGAARSGVNTDITRLDSLQDNSLSGNKISGGIIDTFRSTGIDDNATTTAITIDIIKRVGIGDSSPDAALDVAGSTGIRAEQICDESGNNCKDLSAGWEIDFGTWDSSKNFDTVYQATSAGFVTFTASSPANDSHTYLTGQTSSSSDPTTIRCIARARAIGSIQYSPGASCTMPVRKGDYWRVSVSGTGGTKSLFWSPLVLSN